MSSLQRFERRLEQMISGAFARAFRSAVQPVESAAALQRECDNNAQILSRQRRLVPNDFHVELAQTDLERLAPYDSAMAAELEKQVTEHAQQNGYSFPGPVSIDFEASEDLTTGRFRVRSRALAKVSSNSTHTQVGRARAVLEVNGTQHPLAPPGAIVGRGTDADVYVTSDLRHHPATEFLEHEGPALVDVAHWAAEWTWLPMLARRLEGALGDTVEVRVSTRSTDAWTHRL